MSKIFSLDSSEHKTKVYISKKLGVNRQTLREFLKTHPEIPRKWKRIQKD